LDDHGRVSRWRDRSGHGRDAVQTSLYSRPAHAWAPLLERRVVRFDGDDDSLIFPRLETIRTVFWVARQDAAPGGDDGPVLGDTAKYDFTRGDEGAVLSFRNSSGYLRAGTCRIDGEAVDPTAAPLPERWAVVELRSLGPVRANALATGLLKPGYAFAGDVAEVLVFEQALTDEEMAAVRDWLRAKWGLPPAPGHTNFRLPRDGGRITLADANGRLADRLEYPALPAGVSWGHPETEGALGEQAAFAGPTPGLPNARAYAGVGPAVTIRPVEVRADGPIEVTLGTFDPEAAIYYTLDGTPPAPPLEEPVEVVWADDRIPEGARTAVDQGGGWEWVEAGWDGGRLAHRSPPDDGLRYHLFYGATYSLKLLEGDVLTTWVRLSPQAPPREIMLAWYDGSTEHRAYWGENLINHGAPDTAGRRFMGPLPEPGVWTRLEVPAEAVGLGPERPITGMTFLAYGGEVLWDRSGKLTRQPTGARRYEGPFSLEEPTLVQAVAVRPGSLPGPVAARFFLPGFETRLPVVSLGLPPEWLFDSTRGMYVTGTNASTVPPYYGANFWRDWERPARFHLVEPDGRVLDHGLVGLKIQGAWSRTAAQKSFSLRARGRYGEGRIRWRVFPHLPVEEFDSLILRNSSNDRFYARIRDGFLHDLMAGSAVPGQAFRPAHVFLNSRYWGILNLRERIDDDYLASHYPGEAEEEAVDLIENDMIVLEGDFRAFQELADFIDQASLADPAGYAELLRRVDLDNFLDWVSAEIIVANTDWPDHNVRCWRSRRPDGKWRWILNDLDSAFHSKEEVLTDNTLVRAMTPKPLGRLGGRSTLLFRKLLENPEGRAAFLNRIATLLVTRFDPGRVIAAIDAWEARLAPEMPRQIERWKDEPDPPTGPLPDMAAWRGYVDELRAFARARPDLVRGHLVEAFGLPGVVEITLDARHPRRGQLWLGREPVAMDRLPWTFAWPAGVRLELRAEPAAGARLGGWEGTAQTGTRIEVEPQDDLRLTAVFEDEEAWDPARYSPRPHPLWRGDYRLEAFSEDTPAGVYPPSAEFRQTAQRDPTLEVEMESLWALPYDLDSRSRIVGLDERGIGFINTSNPQEDPGAGYVGELRLALQTSGMTNITVQWLGGTIEPNRRPYAIRLQYRLGDTGPFRDVLDPNGLPVEYVRSPVAGDYVRFGPLTLPAETADQPLVQLRWKYYYLPGGESGPRAFLRLDDIHVTGRPLRPPLSLESVEGDPAAVVVTLNVVPGGRVGVEQSSDLRLWAPV
ncbi:MAG: hypothetical protein D6766_06910, partial [Verrucomicrobia bacterium]